MRAESANPRPVRTSKRDHLRLELELHLAGQQLREGNAIACWQQLVQTVQPLVRRLELPENAAAFATVKMQQMTLIGDALLALIAEAWQAGSLHGCARWLAQSHLQLKDAADYPDRDRHRRLFAAWRQKLKAATDPQQALQKSLAALEAIVAKVRQASLSEARNWQALMTGKLQRLRELQTLLGHPLEVNLANEFEQEVREQIEALEQAERQQQHAADVARLRAAWPRASRDEATTNAFRLANVCKSTSDPSERKDWDALESAFDQQNARRWLLRAIEEVRSNSASKVPLRSTERAVRLDPTLAPVAAVLLGATAFSWLDRSFPELRPAREQLLEQGRMLAEFEATQRTLNQPQWRSELLAETEAFLRRLSTLLMRQPAASGSAQQAARRNARELQRALAPLLRHGNAAELVVVGRIVDNWQQAAPDSFDPRHPLHQLRQRLQVQQRLVAARDLLVQATLHASPAGLQAKAKALAGDAILLQIDQWPPLREAIRLYAVAQIASRPAGARALNRLMKHVAAEYAAVRKLPPADRCQWLRSVTLVMVDRWIEQCSACQNVSRN